jgi:hypothetical protein
MSAGAQQHPTLFEVLPPAAVLPVIGDEDLDLQLDDLL